MLDEFVQGSSDVSASGERPDEESPGEASATPATVSPGDRAVSKPMMLAIMVPFLGMVAWQGPNLWHEWKGLQAEQESVQASGTVGFIGITPFQQYAQPPKNWIHDEADSTLLWSGWDGSAGHQWFRAAKGELDRNRLSGPAGRDVARAIDRPIVEINGGLRWGRITDTSLVAGMQLGKSYTVYPLVLLYNVMIVNDKVGANAVTVIFSPSAGRERCVSAYDPVVDSTRLTFGTSGYYYGNRPLLYDRATESLWVNDGQSVRAVSGHYKGKSLTRIANLPLEEWSNCRTGHEQTRLMIGAERSAKLVGLH
jgi:hypothetical protein